MESNLPPVVFAMPGDLHLTEADCDNYRVAEWAVADIDTLIRPDFVQFIGDNVQDATDAQFGRFVALAGRLHVPWFALVGDHDVHDDPTVSRFRAHVGAPFGALALRGFRFLRLNTQEARPLGLSAPQTDWFYRQADEACAAGERVVVFQHNYPYQVWETFDGPGIDAWRATVQTRRITAIFSGHTHYGQIANDGRNVVIAIRSIGDPEGGPPGYAVVYMHGDDLAIAYRTVEDRGPLVLITHPRALLLATGPVHVVPGSDVVRVRVWAEQAISAVEACVDDGAWRALAPCGEQDWFGPLAGDRLDKGEHRLHVRAVDAGGNPAAQAIDFAVDPTGRYTAVPAVWPPVKRTAFC